MNGRASGVTATRIILSDISPVRSVTVCAWRLPMIDSDRRQISPRSTMHVQCLIDFDRMRTDDFKLQAVIVSASRALTPTLLLDE